MSLKAGLVRSEANDAQQHARVFKGVEPMKQTVAFDDIQALVRFAHGRFSNSRFLLLKINDAKAAGRWLLNTPFSSAESVSPLPDNAVQIAFTATGLKAIGLPEHTLSQFSEEYLVGMSSDESRSRRLGDVDNNAPSHWLWGHHDRDVVHVLLMLYSHTGELDSLHDNLNSIEFQQGFSVVHHLPTCALSPHEPFGFVDGISQPDIDWEQTQRTDIHSREAYSNLLAPGEIVLGYPNEYGQLTRRPLIEHSDKNPTPVLPAAHDQPEKLDFGINGSYLVLRQLQQDVHRFWRFMHQQASGRTDQAIELAEQIVGRHIDGKPMVCPANRNIPGIPKAKTSNHFDFDADSEGIQCPISSHIRRSNPRTGDFPPDSSSTLNRMFRMLGFKRKTEYEDLIASSRFHRLLRRGRVYGGEVIRPQEAAKKTTLPSKEQGLQFICLAGNILRQFEFVQAAWSVGSGFAGLNAQRDPLISHRRPRIDGTQTNLFSAASKEGPQKHTQDLPEFVSVKGGAYFFLPGLRAIRFLGESASGKESIV